MPEAFCDGYGTGHKRKGRKKFFGTETRGKNKTDFSSLKENILTSSPNNSQTIKTETKQEPQSKTLHGLSFLN